MMPTLNDAIEIGSRRFANRTVLAPMVLNCADEHGGPTAAFRDFYLARAEAGVGYLVFGATYVHPAGKGFNRQLGISDDRLMPGLAALVAALRAHCRVGIQLSFKSVGKPPEAFSLDDIRTYRKAFVQAALRARAIGLDAVELHACHEYWLNYFLSPYFNRRGDAYGGSLANRFRLLDEIVDDIRGAVGRDLILGVRLSLDDFVGDGLHPPETIQVARWLAQKGVDYISASGGIAVTQHRTSPPMDLPRGSLLTLAAQLKGQLNIPVIGVGRLDRPDVLRGAVADGHADLAAAARALVADPQYAQKAMAGEDHAIRPCIACNHCLACLYRHQPLRCAVNPFVGRERAKPAPLSRALRVVVAGGGPAGLSAAIHAAGRGAAVTLLERSGQLGGAMIPGKRPPHKAVIQEFTDYLVDRAQRAGVRMVLGCQATVERVLAEAPEHVVVATGGTAVMPDIAGLETHPKVMTAEALLSARSISRDVHLIVGGGAVGLETAAFICAAGGKVTIVEITDSVGAGLHATRLKPLQADLAAGGARVCTGTRVQRVAGRRVLVATGQDAHWIEAVEVLVIAVGYRGDRSLAAALEGHVAVSVVGDAVRPRSICEAVTEGLDAALAISTGGSSAAPDPGPGKTSARRLRPR